MAVTYDVDVIWDVSHGMVDIPVDIRIVLWAIPWKDHGMYDEPVDACYDKGKPHFFCMRRAAAGRRLIDHPVS